MATIAETGEIHASAEAVWKTVRDFSSIDRYASGISRCVMEGHEVGAVRTLTVSNGVICEQLLRIDDANRTLTFAVISSPLPMSSCISTIHVEPLADDRCRVSWQSVFEPRRVSEKGAARILSAVYCTNIDGLRRLHGDNELPQVAEHPPGRSAG